MSSVLSVVDPSLRSSFECFASSAVNLFSVFSVPSVVQSLFNCIMTPFMEIVGKMIRRSSILILAFLLLLSVGLQPARSAGSGTLQVSYINVGQGDSALLQDGAGTDVLIDGGPASAGPALVEYIRAHSDRSLEVVIVSHADADHSGGLVTLLQASDIAIDHIYTNGYPGSTQTWNDLVSEAAARAIPMTPAQFPAEFTWGGLKAYILNPAPGMVNPAQNDASVVARIDFQDRRFLFPGDISSTIEATVVARQTPVAADVLKVAHHGSASSSSAAFLAAVHPAEAVISVGPNSYGHPSPETLSRLANQGVQIWRTDRSGTILVTSDGVSVTFPPAETGAFAVYLALISRPDAVSTPSPTETSTETPTQPPVLGPNQQCVASGVSTLCAWVSNAAPSQGSNLTVSAQLWVNGVGQSGQAMTTSWHYKSTTPTCAGTTDASGLASCARSIGQASAGYKVNVDVQLGGQSVTTWFTPN